MLDRAHRSPPVLRARLRERLARVGQDGPLVIPGAYDGLSARLVAQAGFPAVYLSGFAASAALLGQPDIGLLSASEMVDCARRLVAAVDVPVVADADTGYGNALNVARTVQLYEQAGVSAIQLEDQVSPKRCGHMAGKDVIAEAEMVAKVRAAVDARTDPGLVIIARTDAVAVDGVDAAIGRARAYRDAGADALFVEAPTSEAEIEGIAAALAADMPLVFNWAEGGRTPPLPFDTIAKLGFAVVLCPIGTVLAATAAIQSLLAAVATDGTPERAVAGLPTFDEFTTVVGLPDIRAVETRYTS